METIRTKKKREFFLWHLANLATLLPMVSARFSYYLLRFHSICITNIFAGFTDGSCDLFINNGSSYNNHIKANYALASLSLSISLESDDGMTRETTTRGKSFFTTD